MKTLIIKKLLPIFLLNIVFLTGCDNGPVISNKRVFYESSSFELVSERPIDKMELSVVEAYHDGELYSTRPEYFCLYETVASKENVYKLYISSYDYSYTNQLEAANKYYIYTFSDQKESWPIYCYLELEIEFEDNQANVTFTSIDNQYLFRSSRDPWQLPTAFYKEASK